jgi:glycosyltransferase involved in cell wall biosynthesis
MASAGILLERMMAKLPDIGIAVSETTADRLKRLTKMKAEKIRIIPNGVDLKKFDGVKVEKDERKVIYVGRLNPHKRIEMLVDALARLRRDGVKLEIVGDGPMRPKYEEYVRRRGLQDRVQFSGALDDGRLIEKLASAYVYVLPSVREGQSITTLEAMAAGTPQVVLDVEGNGAAELLRKSNSGIIAEPSPKSLSEAIIRLREDRNLWRRSRENGLSYVKGYDWDRIAERYLEACRSLL